MEELGETGTRLEDGKEGVTKFIGTCKYGNWQLFALKESLEWRRSFEGEQTREERSHKMGGIEALVEVQNLYYEPDKYIIDELWDDLLIGVWENKCWWIGGCD